MMSTTIPSGTDSEATPVDLDAFALNFFGVDSLEALWQSNVRPWQTAVEGAFAYVSATWEADFARIEGRPPNARDIAEDKARQRDTNFDRPSQRPRARVDLTPCRFPGPAGACAPRSQAQDAPA